MKPVKLFRLIQILGLLLFVSSCYTHSPNTTESITRELAFATTIPIEEVNSYITIKLADENYVVNPDDPIRLVLENHSQYAIRFQDDFSVKIFYYSIDDNTWIKIDNRVNYNSAGANILEAKGGLFSETPVTIFPVFPSGISIDTIRVAVSGNIESDGAIKLDQSLVVAYVDIDLK